MDFDPTAYWKWLCRCCGDTCFTSERPRDCPTCYAPAEEFVRLSELVEDE